MTREEADLQLAPHRRSIDEIDRKILELLNQRTTIVECIGQIKRESGIPVYEPRREDDVFRNVMENNPGPLPSDAVKRVFERIIDEMRAVQRHQAPQLQPTQSAPKES